MAKEALSNAGLAHIVDGEGGAARWAFIFYCAFVVSYFVHLGARVPALGAMRIDILLCAASLATGMGAGKTGAGQAQGTFGLSRLMFILCFYIILSLPFVKWPGSVIGKGWDPFLKAILFYFLTIKTVNSEARLRAFVIVFLATQAFRVLEPLYLHLTTGYWGSFTNMGNYELMNRLSGAPFDIVNPNGLAFIILVVVTLAHHVFPRDSVKSWASYAALLGAMLYALSLTGSRSGMTVMGVFALLVVWQSKHRAAALVALGVIVSLLLVSMDDLERQRYLSIVDHSAKGGESAQGRIDGVMSDFLVGMQRPIFGHGLGTSLEANANATGEALPSHNLYTEVFQELGAVGLVIFVAFLTKIWKSCVEARRILSQTPGKFSARVANGCRDLAIVLVVFSLASYGLNEYQWYLLAGLAVVLRNLAKGAEHAAVNSESSGKVGGTSSPGGDRRYAVVSRST